MALGTIGLNLFIMWHKLNKSDKSLKIESVFPQVVIEGMVGSGYRGDIAIDDVSMTPGCRPATRKMPYFHSRFFLGTLKSIQYLLFQETFCLKICRVSYNYKKCNLIL